MNFFLASILNIGLIVSICDYKTQGVDGVGCLDLAKACTPSYDLYQPDQKATFYGYNPNLKTDCSNLTPNQRVCCTEGGLAPSPNPDGSCATYEVKNGNNCGVIGGQFGLTIDEINTFNGYNTTSFHGTWGFRGCDQLQPGLICLSEGTSGPIPAKSNDIHVECGPTASGNGTNVKCPLNVCCNNWGHCGLTEEFCVSTIYDTNEKQVQNPGISGCQDNCGMDYYPVSGSDPSGGGAEDNFIKLGYYESWNQKWNCLRMSMDDVQRAVTQRGYTHLHYAFGEIGPDFTISVPPSQSDLFANFTQLQNVKKVISIGGWAFSTDPATTWRFIDATLPANRATFISNLVNFAQVHNLDGLDFDWEYPGAPDIPGAANHAGPDDGLNYLAFLTELRSAYDGSISFAAPASYWYLKNFPIYEMSKVINYIVYMTYDLHGQWDSGNTWIDGGNKLRSHVNWTETMNTLTMISTKAGVESSKILLGIGSYGRSFQPTDINCDGPNCTFGGSNTASNAMPGRCTGTSGYLANAEINEILYGNLTGVQVVNYRYDPVSDSQLLTFTANGSANWVSFMTPETVQGRIKRAQSLGLGGTIEWAIDLEEFSDDELADGEGGFLTSGWIEVELDYSECPTNIKTLDDLLALSPDDYDDDCIDYAIAQYYNNKLQNALSSYQNVRQLPDTTTCTPTRGDLVCHTYPDQTQSYANRYREYFKYVSSQSDRMMDIYFDTAFQQSDQSFVTSFDKYINCPGNCEDGGSVTLKDWAGLIGDISNTLGASYVLKNGTYLFPYMFDHDKNQNTIKYTNFPIVDYDSSFPNPFNDQFEAQLSTIHLIAQELNNAVSNPNNYYGSFKDIVISMSKVIDSFEGAVNTMKQIVDIGNKIIIAEKNAVTQLVLSIMETLGIILISFIPVVGDIAAGGLAIALAAARGDKDEANYLLSAAQVVTGVYSVFSTVKSFASAARFVEGSDQALNAAKGFEYALKGDKSFTEIENALKTCSK